MTRGHAPQYRLPADPYGASRCGCGHLIYAGQAPGDRCRFFGEGCDCTDHRPKEVAGDGASDA